MSVEALNQQQLKYFFEQLWKQSLNPIWVCEVVPNDFVMVSANDAAMRVDPNQSPGTLVSDVLAKSGHAPELISGYFTCIETKEMVEFEQRPWIGGKEYLYRTLLVPIINETGTVTHIWGTAHNLTDFLDPQKELLAINQLLEKKIHERTEQLRQAMDKLEELSETDELTGLSNRRRFKRHIQVLMTERRSLAFLYIDIDFFKRYNDRYGHSAGDTCLQKVAAILQSFERRPGELVARYGGEEFVMVLPDCDQAYALQVAEEIREGVHAAKISHVASRIPDEEYLTASIGVTFATAGEADADAILKAADDALYEAKSAGRNRVCFQAL